MEAFGGTMAVDPACSQCGRMLPTDPAQVTLWRHGPLVLAGQIDEAGLLLCPECDAEERGGVFEEGTGD